MNSFSPKVFEHLGYYVYELVDPRTNKSFYIGKGTGNRVFEHEKCALNSSDSSLKLDLIREIHANNLEVKKRIICHGLDEDTAFKIEAAFISYFKDNLSNIVEGHHTELNGVKTVEEIEDMYNCSDTELIDDDKFLCLNVNRSFSTDEDLYNIASGMWVINPKRANRANYVLVISNSIVRGMFDVTWWEKIDKKWKFHGKQIKRHKYLNTNIGKIITFRQNPVRYYNI